MRRAACWTQLCRRLPAMPSRSRNGLASRGEVDLRGVRAVSDRAYLWTTNHSTLGRLAGLFASAIQRGGLRRLQQREFSTAFDARVTAPMRGSGIAREALDDRSDSLQYAPSAHRV